MNILNPRIYQIKIIATGQDEQGGYKTKHRAHYFHIFKRNYDYSIYKSNPFAYRILQNYFQHLK